MRRDANIFNVPKAQMVRNSEYILKLTYDYNKRKTSIEQEEKFNHLPMTDVHIFLQEAINQLNEKIKTIKGKKLE